MFSKLSPPLLLSLILLSGCEAAPTVDLKQADRALAEHRFYDARGQLMAIRDAAGPSADTAQKLARVALELGDGYAAEYHLGEWRSISGESSDWVAMRAHSMILEGSPRSARELIKQFNGTRPLPARHEWLLVWTAMEEGKPEKAQELVSAALARYPQSADLHARAGRLMAMQGDWAAADEHVTSALQADPHHFEALLLQGESRIAKGDLAGALEPYQIAVKTYPDFAVPYANSAGLLLDLGRMDEAEKSLATALARHPNFPLLRFSAARLNAMRGRWADARSSLQAMPMEFKRGFPAATLLEAEAESALGNHAMARSLIESLASKPGMRDQVAELLKRLPAAS